MTEESDAAHQEAEAFLRGGSGQSIAAVGAIVSKHRSGIQVQSADLHAHVANDTLLFTNKFPLSPGGGGPKVKQAGGAGGGSTPDQSTDPPAPGPPGPPSHAPGLNGGGIRPDASTPGPGGVPQVPGGRIPGHSWDAAPHPGHGPLTSLLGAGTGLPSLPTGGGGSGFPFSGFQGLLGGLRRFPGRGYATDGGFDFGGDSAGGAVVGDGFRAGSGCGRDGGGRGSACAAGTNDSARGPSGERPYSGGAAAAPVSAPTPAPAPAPVSAPGVPAGGLTPYGSVLPPTAAACAVGRVGAGATVDTG